MGINGLLKIFINQLIPRKLDYYQGKRIGIDGFGWLHKSIYVNKEDIINNDDSDQFLFYLKYKLMGFIKAGNIPIVILDGMKLPIKGCEEEYREGKRMELKNKGYELIENGLYDKGVSCLIRSININNKIANKFKILCDSMNIECIVARKNFIKFKHMKQMHNYVIYQR